MVLKILNGVRAIEEWFVRVILALMVLATFLAATNRFTIAVPLMWPEELVRILMAWLCFIGAPIGLRLGAHIGINVFVDMLPVGVRRWIMRGMYILGFILCCILFYGGVKNWSNNFMQKTPAMRISIGWRYACVPIGAVFMAVEFVCLFVNSFRDDAPAEV